MIHVRLVTDYIRSGYSESPNIRRIYIRSGPQKSEKDFRGPLLFMECFVLYDWNESRSPGLKALLSSFIYTWRSEK